MEPGTACRLLQPLRCAGTTARTCALGTRGTAIRLGFEPCPTRFRAPVHRARRAPQAASHRLASPTGEERRGDRDSRSFRPPVPVRVRLGCHRMAATGRGASWLSPRYPCRRSPSRQAQMVARRESRPAKTPRRGALREETPSYEGPRYLSPQQAPSSMPGVGHPFTRPRRLSLRMTRRLELGVATEPARSSVGSG